MVEHVSCDILGEKNFDTIYLMVLLNLVDAFQSNEGPIEFRTGNIHIGKSRSLQIISKSIFDPNVRVRLAS